MASSGVSAVLVRTRTARGSSKGSAVASALLGGQCRSLADYVTVTAPTGEAVAAGCRECRLRTLGEREVGDSVPVVESLHVGLCLRLPRGCGVRGWERDGLGTGRREGGARARRALMSTTRRSFPERT